MAIEEKLKDYGITFIRTDIGDKYVCEKMEEMNLSLGGEKSGHIIIKDFSKLIPCPSTQLQRI